MKLGYSQKIEKVGEIIYKIQQKSKKISNQKKNETRNGKCEEIKRYLWGEEE